MKIKAFMLAAALTACGGATQTATTTPATVPGAKLAIKLTTIYVDDQEKALRFYTDVLGLAKKDDVSNSGFRWLTVTAPGDANGTQLLLAKDDNPAANALQETLFAQGQAAAMLFTDDVQREYERLQARGAEFTLPPTEVPAYATIAIVNDTCGNLVQITQLR
jgi:predicted enzyme related to lactoylglutathione lyase